MICGPTNYASADTIAHSNFDPALGEELVTPGPFARASEHIVAALQRAPVEREPFPYVFIDDAFPADFYASLLQHLPLTSNYRRLVDTGRVGKHYSPERFVVDCGVESMEGLPGSQREFWQGLFDAFSSATFAQAFLDKFASDLSARFLGANGERIDLQFSQDVLLIRDYRNYFLRPHTDSPLKLVSVLIYLAADDARPGMGTTFFSPHDRKMTSEGGEGHDYGQFSPVRTLPYLPNRMLAFPKTNRSFHGVMPVAGYDDRRDILLYDLKMPYEYWTNTRDSVRSQDSEPASGKSTKVS